MKFKNLCILLAGLSLCFVFSSHGFEVEDCLECHGDMESWDLNDKEEALLFVDSEKFSNSVHSDFSCLDCHEGIDDLPHEDSLPKVSCSNCHDDVMDVYSDSVHSESLSDAGLGEGAQCISCHGVHDILPASDPDSTVHHHNLANTCITCHEDQALIIKHDLPSKDEIQSYVYSAHGHSNLDDPNSKAATCNNCHGWHDTKSHKSSESKVSRENVAETCGACHSDVLEVYYESVHGDLAKQGNPDTAVCTDCHGEHSIVSPEERTSTVSKFSISETCAKCHENQELVEKYGIPISTPSTFYKMSVHGKALAEGNTDEAAACHDCHGYHSILGGYSSGWKITKKKCQIIIARVASQAS